MRFYDDEEEANPLSVPYVYDGVESGTMWNYKAHAQLTYALISVEDEVLPGAGEIDYAPAPFFRECIRQATVLAIQRSPKGFFENAKHKKAAYVANGQDVPEAMRETVAEKLERADRLVDDFFSEEVWLSENAGGQLIDDIIDNRQEARYRNLDSQFMQH